MTSPSDLLRQASSAHSPPEVAASAPDSGGIVPTQMAGAAEGARGEEEEEEAGEAENQNDRPTTLVGNESPLQVALRRLATGQILTEDKRDWFPKGRCPEEDSVAKEAGANGVAIACTPEFWRQLGCDRHSQRAGAFLKLLVKAANGRTFPATGYPETAQQGSKRWTWHVVPSIEALKAQARATSVQELEAVLNMHAKHSKLRNEQKLETCPECNTPLVQNEIALMNMYRCARGGQCGHAPPLPPPLPSPMQASIGQPNILPAPSSSTSAPAQASSQQWNLVSPGEFVAAMAENNNRIWGSL